ncbi:hypothetical protein GON03_04685 [Nocardioides sp. MAH-18]|uniref:Uncharacterized protein n=1 Tax=Nocardioides agri TaxID=2682843 RepID=A0A6L6XS59_9ACTN|nr:MULTISPECIES: hypothetical protein [unclassified Nocardioides]MBA2953600.1 hypothetical protein [Nocardioides sp. CGMCC 1.13656]MVQ48465.1 hypothetical protein [Nocardioides sp. MAH-18]
MRVLLRFAALLLVAALGLHAGDAVADDGSLLLTGSVTPGTGLPGSRVTVESVGWPALTQVQGVVCGDLGVGGSTACDQSAGQLGAADAQGRLRLDMIVGTPPAPCPCIVRITSYVGPSLTLDLPFTVTGHPTGTPPVPEQPEAEVVVSGVQFVPDPGIAPLFGAAQDGKLVVTLLNRGNKAAENPSLLIGAGKSPDVEPTGLTTTEVVIDPLQTAEVSVDAKLPVGAFGTYYLAATTTTGDGPVLSATYTTYPWALVALNVVGLALVLAGLWRRRTAGRRSVQASARHRWEATPYPLPDVVYVEAVGGFLISPEAAGRSRMLGRVKGRLETRDLAALLGIAGEFPPAGTDAVVDLAAADRWLARRGAGGVAAAVPEAIAVGGGAAPAVVDLDAATTWFARSASRGKEKR